MMETIQTIAVNLAIAALLAAIAWLLRTRKQQFIKMLTDLIEKAEGAIQGSKMGAEKKAKVLAQLAAMQIKVTPAVDKLIDKIVAVLNEKNGWLVGKSEDAANDVIDEVMGSGDTE